MNAANIWPSCDLATSAALPIKVIFSGMGFTASASACSFSGTLSPSACNLLTASCALLPRLSNSFSVSLDFPPIFSTASDIRIAS